MNFFAAQERARKETRKLVFWFALCLIGVVGTMYAVLIVIEHLSVANGQVQQAPITWWRPDWFLWTTLIVGGIILIGSLSKLAQLSGGGNVVARSLGGRPIDPSTRDLKERRLLNVVEEMAIASGSPAPEVWIMDGEEGINAFAAGTDPANAVIGVTRGTLDRLTRNELQGVVAHEFSHILNGDMKLNMRLMGWIFGLVMISVVGRLLIESIRFMRGSRDSKGNGVILGIAALGIAVWIVGSIGVLFARILQAAISRQREFLADASAVQFTRYPDGIAGALKKIGGFSEHGTIHSAKATEARHMFFAPSSLSSLLATHPPLDQRIKAIDPHWQGEMLTGKADPVTPEEFNGSMGFAGATTNAPSSTPQVKDLSSCEDAKSLLLGLLIPTTTEAQAQGLLVSRGIDAQVIQSTLQWGRSLETTNKAQKLSLIDRSLPWLRKMSHPEAREFIATCETLVEADGQVDLFEFMMQQVIRRQIEIGLGLEPVPMIRHHKLVDLECEMGDLLSLFGALAKDPEALAKATLAYSETTGRQIAPPTKPNLGRVAKALIEMDAATPLVKQQILQICALVATYDQLIVDNESVMLRATAEAIGVPIPENARV